MLLRMRKPQLVRCSAFAITMECHEVPQVVSQRRCAWWALQTCVGPQVQHSHHPLAHAGGSAGVQGGLRSHAAPGWRVCSQAASCSATSRRVGRSREFGGGEVRDSSPAGEGRPVPHGLADAPCPVQQPCHDGAVPLLHPPAGARARCLATRYSGSPMWLSSAWHKCDSTCVQLCMIGLGQQSSNPGSNCQDLPPWTMRQD